MTTRKLAVFIGGRRTRFQAIAAFWLDCWWLSGLRLSKRLFLLSADLHLSCRSCFGICEVLGNNLMSWTKQRCHQIWWTDLYDLLQMRIQQLQIFPIDLAGSWDYVSRLWFYASFCSSNTRTIISWAHSSFCIIVATQEPYFWISAKKRCIIIPASQRIFDWTEWALSREQIQKSL